MSVDTKKKDLAYYAALPYTTIIERRDDANKPYWVARILELPHCLIHGDTPEEAAKEIEEVKLEWIESNLEDGLTIPEPQKYSGQFHIRMTPSLHKSMAQLAEMHNISLNQYLNILISRAVGVEEGIELMRHTNIPMNISRPARTIQRERIKKRAAEIRERTAGNKDLEISHR